MNADIVIPVHNSPKDVQRCLSTCIVSLRHGDRVILVDDGSAPQTEAICQRAAEANPGKVRLIRRSQGSGFCRAGNVGIRETDAPVVILLNSDTVVPPGWLDRIEGCFAANSDIGIVGPLSNAGGWQSIPELIFGGPKSNNVASDDASIADIHEFCGRFRSRYEHPVVEQVNGFCLAIRREVINAVGLLDERNFPMGYGEEVDFNFRAQDAGFISVIAIDCFVYHCKTKSYTNEMRKQLVAAGRARNDRIHGRDRVKSAVTGTRENPILRAIRVEAMQAFIERGWLLSSEAEGLA